MPSSAAAKSSLRGSRFADGDKRERDVEILGHAGRDSRCGVRFVRAVDAADDRAWAQGAISWERLRVGHDEHGPARVGGELL